jgi:hypothetical protein
LTGEGNGSTRRKPAPVPLCSPQNPHAVRTRTRAAAVGSQLLTASATAWPCNFTEEYQCHQLHIKCPIFLSRLALV